MNALLDEAKFRVFNGGEGLDWHITKWGVWVVWRRRRGWGERRGSYILICDPLQMQSNNLQLFAHSLRLDLRHKYFKWTPTMSVKKVAEYLEFFRFFLFHKLVYFDCGLWHTNSKDHWCLTVRYLVEVKQKKRPKKIVLIFHLFF